MRRATIATGKLAKPRRKLSKRPNDAPGPLKKLLTKPNNVPGRLNKRHALLCHALLYLL
jgi:hypothetical protein